MALDEEVWRSNLGRGSEIERLRVKGARAAALAAPAACSRGGAAPEKTELGLPGADSNGGWVGRHLRDMRNPPKAMERRIGAWSDLGKARGGAGPWGSPANERARSAGLRLGPGSIWVRAQSQTKARVRRCGSAGGSPQRGCSASGGGTPACSAQGSGVGYGLDT